VRQSGWPKDLPPRRGKNGIDYRLVPDFPSTDPRRTTQPYRDFWMLGISETGQRGRKFFDQLVQADWTKKGPDDLYQAPPRHYLGGSRFLSLTHAMREREW
jgi:carotenoid cleavage dioxygenase-like enzyme